MPTRIIRKDKEIPKIFQFKKILNQFYSLAGNLFRLKSDINLRN